MTVVDTLLADRPVLLWLLDETSGGKFRDLTRSGNDANMSGPPLVGLPGPGLGVLASARFNGAGHSANRDPAVGATAAVFPLGSAARTLEIWARPTGAGSYCVLAYGVAASTNEHCNFQVGGTGGSSAFSDGVNVGNNKGWTTAATVNAWGHFAMTYAGGADGAAIFYRNGVANTTTTMSLNTAGPVGRLRAGLRSDDGRATAYFLGDLAVAAIYATALPAARIRTHYLAGLGIGSRSVAGAGRTLRLR